MSAGHALLEEEPKVILARKKFNKTTLQKAHNLLKKDPAFKALCEAKAYAGIAGDLHKSTASQMYQVAIEAVSKIQRNATKAIVFGSMFGRGAKAIAQQLGLDDIKEVEGRIAAFFSQFKHAEEWFYDIEDFGETNGYVESPIGRRRRLITFQIKGANKGDIARAKRISRNAPIQGISSDGAFLGAALFSDWLIEEGKWHVQPTKECWKLQDVVHDSLVMQVPLEDVPEAVEAVRPWFTTKLMERMTEIWGVNFNIPLEVDFELGLKWGDMESWDGTQIHLDYLMNRLRKKNVERRAKQEKQE
jgi:DNA polymerase-1